MATAPSSTAGSVFINCPFDKDYWPLFEVLTFTVLACGFTPRSALEVSDGGEVRFEKLRRIIRECRYGIHDISRVELDGSSNLPRFNMPFELGLDLGCRYFGTTAQRKKRILILDSEPYRYQVSLSDIAGQDIKAHGNNPDTICKGVRDWLRSSSGRTTIPGHVDIVKSFRSFAANLPMICNKFGVDRDYLPYVDYVTFAEDWLSPPAA